MKTNNVCDYCINEEKDICPSCNDFNKFEGIDTTELELRNHFDEKGNIQDHYKNR